MELTFLEALCMSGVQLPQREEVSSMQIVAESMLGGVYPGMNSDYNQSTQTKSKKI